MAIVANFSAAQPLGSPEDIILVDTSTGSDAAITQRRVYLRTSQGNFLVPEGNPSDEYVEWPYADATITSDVLKYDYALNIVVQWLDVSNNILYSKEQLFGFTSYNENFDYGLTQQLTANPSLFNDDSFFENKSALRTYIDSGNQAIEKASDISGAQQCYNSATSLRLNSQYFFNKNS